MKIGLIKWKWTYLKKTYLILFIPNEFLNNKIIIINLGVGAEQNE